MPYPAKVLIEESATEATISRHAVDARTILTVVHPDITERKALEDQRDAIARELDHRIGNGLAADNSLVAHAVAQGHTVFLVSWRNVSAAQGRLGWDDYLALGVIAAIDTALAISGADRVNTLGFCVGGTLLACALAVLAARGEHKASSMTLLTTMLDFRDTGEIGLLVGGELLADEERRGRVPEGLREVEAHGGFDRVDGVVVEERRGIGCLRQRRGVEGPVTG
jgi:hypothetical protein